MKINILIDILVGLISLSFWLNHQNKYFDEWIDSICHFFSINKYQFKRNLISVIIIILPILIHSCVLSISDIRDWLSAIASPLALIFIALLITKPYNEKTLNLQKEQQEIKEKQRENSRLIQSMKNSLTEETFYLNKQSTLLDAASIEKEAAELKREAASIEKEIAQQKRNRIFLDGGSR